MPHQRLSSLALAVALGFGLLMTALGLLAPASRVLAREGQPALATAAGQLRPAAQGSPPFNINIVPGSALTNINRVGQTFVATGPTATLGVDHLRDALTNGDTVVSTGLGSSGAQSGTITLTATALLNYNGSGLNRSLTLSAAHDILIYGVISDSVPGSDRLNLTLTADQDGSGGGAVFIGGGRLETGGGSITATGNGHAGRLSGVSTGGNALVDSGGGGILFKGRAYPASGGSGVQIGPEIILKTGGGPLELTGTAGPTGTGVLLTTASVDAGSGPITMTASTVGINADAYVSGSGPLRLQPLTAAASFTISEVSLGALGDGFSLMTIGRNDSAGVIGLSGGPWSVSDPLLLQAPGPGGQIDLSGNSLLATGNATVTLLAGGNIRANAIDNSGRAVSLTSLNGNITTFGINTGVIDGNANGGGISLVAPGGSITTAQLNARVFNSVLAAGSGGPVTVSAGGNITLDGIETGSRTVGGVSAANGGPVSVTSSGGSIWVGGISSFSEASGPSGVAGSGGSVGVTALAGNITVDGGTDVAPVGSWSRAGTVSGSAAAGGSVGLLAGGSVVITGSRSVDTSSATAGGAANPAGIAGSVVISAGGNIHITAIEAEGKGSNLSGAGGLVVLRGNFIRATTATTFSINTGGTAAGGVITISHRGNGLTPFLVGNGAVNGTGGGLTTGGATLTPTRAFFNSHTEPGPPDIYIVTTNFYTGVNTFADDNIANGNCTLREAVIAANTNSPVDACRAGKPGLDVITLTQGVYALTITGADEDAAASGDLDITEPLLIKGADMFSTSVDGPFHGDRIFHVLTGSLMLQDMAVLSGTTSRDGGGILHESGEPLRLTRVSVAQNTAPAGNGGGLAVMRGTLWLTETLIGFNTALTEGGGVLLGGANLAAMRAYSGVIIFNEAAMGAGIFARGGLATVADSLLFLNTATISGGGAYLAAGQLTLAGTEISGNQAGSGGGLYIAGGAGVISASQVVTNYATGSGGGLYVAGGVAHLKSGQIGGNLADDAGGGVAISGGEGLFSGGQIITNTAVNNGGGLMVGGGVITLSGSQVLSNSAAGGGGLALDGGSGALSGGAVGFNRAGSGGGVLVGFNAAFTQTNGVIEANHATLSGGGLASIDAGQVRLSGGKIFSNSAGVDGGGLYIFNNASFRGVILSGVEVISNVAQSGSGGGLHIDISQGGGVKLTAGRIEGNRAAQLGGGIYANDLFAMSGGQIGGNSATSGGGLYVSSSISGATISGGRVVSNSARGTDLAEGGGGIYLAAGTLHLSGAEIGYNRADNAAGIGVSGASAVLSQTGVVTIAHNVAAQNGGGVGVRDNGQASLNGARLLYNRALGSGGGFRQTGGTLTVNNSCIAGNDDPAGSYVGGVAPIDAGGNWWGAADGPGGAGPGNGDSVTSDVDFSGFLTSPPAGCPFVGALALWVVESGGDTRVAEGGASDAYSVRLTQPPAAPVPVAITTDGQTTVLPNVITFTTANWSVAQQVLVFAVDDAIPEYFHTGDISHSAAVADGRGSIILTATVTAHITDNDVAADVQAQKSAPAAAIQGTKFTYAITVTNHGPWPATNLVITDTLPGGAAALAGQAGSNFALNFDPPLPGDRLGTAATFCLPSGNIFRCNVDVLQPGGKMLLNLEYTPLANGLLVNRVEARASEPDPGPNPNRAEAGTAVGAIDVDLVLAKRALAGTVQVGRPVTYSLTLTNTGSDAAFGVTVVDTLPPNFTVTAINSTQGSCESGDGAVTCGIGTVSPGEPLQISISAVPSVTYNSPTVVVNSATAFVGVGSDITPGNNTGTAPVTVTPTAANLVITKTASAANALVGDRLVYTLTAANLLSSSVSGARLVDALPAGVGVASIQPSQGSCQVSQASVVTCQLGTLTPAGARVVLAVIPTRAGVITNSATITSPFAFETEPGNNTAPPVATTVTARRVDLSLSKVAATPAITVGRGLVYTLTVANAPTADPATAVVLTDTLPAAVTLGQTITPTGSCTVAGQVVNCALGQLAPGASRRVALLVTPTVVATFTNVATVADTYGRDVAPLNNSAAVTVTSLGLGQVAAPGVTTTLAITLPGERVITVLAPAGAVSQSIRLQLEPVGLPASPPGGFGFAGIAFRLNAYSYPGGALLPGYVFSRAISITLQYRDADLANIADENTLVLYYLNTGNWADAAATCGAGSAPVRFPGTNRLTVAVCHLTDFALLGKLQTTPTYLPVILKGGP